MWEQLTEYGKRHDDISARRACIQEPSGTLRSARHNTVEIQFEIFILPAKYNTVNQNILILASCKNIYPSNYAETDKV